jgi:hypothetical protein
MSWAAEPEKINKLFVFKMYIKLHVSALVMSHLQDCSRILYIQFYTKIKKSRC